MVTEVTACVGNTVTVRFDDNTYSVQFTDNNEANLFKDELIDTVNDFNVNGRDKCKRKKSMFADPKTCSVSLNFDTDNSNKKWKMKATLSSAEEMNAFFKDVKFAIYGPMPGI